MSTTLTDRVAGSAAISDPASDLEAIEVLTGAGIAARTGTNQWALRTLTGPSAGIAVTFGDGAGGDPTLTLANDLAQLEGFSSTGIAVRTATDAWAQRSIAVSGTGLSVSNADGAAGNPTVTINPSQVVSAGGAPTVAAQSDQETATSTTTYVSPGRQQFHPSAAKCWAYVTVSAGTPTLQTSYNITSITDTATGQVTITIATDFSSAQWCASVSAERASTALAVANARNVTVRNGGMAAGSILIEGIDETATTANQVDPAAWHFIGFGDQ